MADYQHKLYKDLLIQISDIVDKKSLDAMKFRCDKLIGSREREKITSPLQLWDALEKRDCLGASNLQFLKELLQSCMGGRLDGIRLVEHYESMLATQEHQSMSMNGHVAAAVQGQGTVFQPFKPIQPPNIQFLAQRENNELQKEMNFLSNSLGRDWPFFIRELDVPECEIDNIKMDYRFTKDQIYQCLLVWRKLHKDSATKDRLLSALRDIHRNDLVTRMEQGDY